MASAEKYSSFDSLRDGRRFEVRAQRSADRTDLLSVVERTSAQSFFTRFFAVKRHFSEREIEFFTNVDFINHVALVAVVEENGRPVIVGACRYVVLRPAKAEVAFMVIDQYQGQGVGSALMRHLVTLAREAGIEELVAEVLPDNISMLNVLKKSGLILSTKREPDVVHVVLRLS